MVYVDSIKARCGKRTCHMAASGGTKELHQFAKKIGVSTWSYHNGRIKHYDLTSKQRQVAIETGAKLVSERQLIRACR